MKVCINFGKTIQVLSILTLIGTAIFLFWLYKIGILNDQNVLSDLIKSQGALGSLSPFSYSDYSSCISDYSRRCYDCCGFPRISFLVGILSQLS